MTLTELVLGVGIAAVFLVLVLALIAIGIISTLQDYGE